MKAVRSFPMLATAGLLALAAWAPHAVAGHANPVLEAELDGREEVGAQGDKKPGDRNARGKGYVFGIDADAKDRSTLCYILTDFKNLSELDEGPLPGKRMAHIHKGARGENGLVVVNLAWPQDGQAGDCLSESTADKFVNGGNVKEILANPQNFYINVHNSEFPAGAVRGQLMESGSHSHGKGHSHGGKDKKN